MINNYSRKGLTFLLVIMFSISLLVGCSSSENTENGQQEGSNLDGKIIGIACLPAGSANGIIAEALAAAITENTPMTARTEPSSGPASWLGTLERGEIEFGFASDFDVWKAFEGDPNIYDRAYNNIKAVKLGSNVNKASIVVAKDSSIKTINDLAGKRVAIDIPALPNLQATTEMLLIGAGVDLNDIERVKIESLNDGLRALAEGRVDATIGSLGSGAVEEANASIGVRYLAADISEEGLSRAREIFPGIDGIVIEAGPTGVVEDTPFYAWGLCLITAEDVSDEIVYEVTKALYEGYDNYKDVHTAMKSFAPEYSMSKLLPIPAHEASIKYYKEVNAWNEDIEKRHNELLKQN